MSLHWIPLVPALGGLLISLCPADREVWMHRLASYFSAALSLLVMATFVQAWQHPIADFKAPLFDWEGHHFGLTLHLDLAGGIFLFMTALLGGLVVRFSRFYMHREPGQRRFFSTLLFFLAGMSGVVLAHDLDTLFLAWEVVGISSFLLIGFYRQREGPVRNALKVYCIYRLCDVGLLVGAYLQHHDLGTAEFDTMAAHSLPGHHLLILSLLLLLSAAGKSAQFPFSFWVARAMEGPTPSSAIFYGALSIHAGVFLLLRTAPIWQASLTARVAVACVGLFTAFLATGISHVQSNIKGQIAYSSVAQVGLMFAELALGWNHWVLVHFVGNASLRCYQLLISPSLVAYLLRQQSTAGSHSLASDFSLERVLPHRLRSTLFVLVSQEAYMENLVNAMFFRLTQWVARHLMAENRNITVVWTRSLALSLTAALSIGFCVHGLHTLEPYLVGIVVSYLLGLAGIGLLPRELRGLPLDRFRGVTVEHPWSARLLFLSFLGMSGFPISPAFFGVDLLLSSAVHLHLLAALGFTFLFILNGIVLARCFSRLCLGSGQPLINTTTLRLSTR